MKNLKIFIVLFVYIFFSFGYYIFSSESVFNEISESVLRLHVIANSNSKEDQEVKLKVRDAIISYMQDNCNVINSKIEASEWIKNNLNEIQEIANNVLKENNFSYDVNVEIGNFFFPTKFYGNVSFPEGRYDALKVKLGNANGDNWWCVMFPPLCFINSNPQFYDDKILKNELSNEAYEIIYNDSEEIKFKFKSIEFFEEIKEGIYNLF